MKSPKNLELDLKAKRVVYQMSQELEISDVHDDFHNALLSLTMPQIEKEAGFDGFLRLQNEIKESLKTYLKFGETSHLLRLLSASQMKSVDHMLKSKLKSSTFETEFHDGEYSGKVVIAKKVQIVADVENWKTRRDLPKNPVPLNVPPLEVAELYNDNDSDREDSDGLEWVSSQPVRSSGGVPMEPVPRPISIRKTEKAVSQSRVPAVPANKIASRARPIEKSDAQMQTEQVAEKRTEKVNTAEIGTNCNLIATPRVLEDDEELPLLSPQSSTLQSDLSEGEEAGVLSPSTVIITVTSSGKIVATPRAIEDIDDDSEDVEQESSILKPSSNHIPYSFIDSDVLFSKLSSPFGVAETDMSVSSARSL